MCIAYLAVATHSKWPLFIAANRDEFHARPTRPTAPWPEAPDVMGGKDLQAGGTWFAVQKKGRFALLTNFRDMAPATGLELSRGHLCKDFLINTDLSAHDYIYQVANQKHLYQGFNLIIGQWHADQAQFSCYYFSNRSHQEPVALAPGHYVVSNHLLNTPWPKSSRLLAGLQQHVQQGNPIDVDAAYTLLRDEQKAADDLLPATGLDLERERLLSSPFIVSHEYGTRSSSVWAVANTGHSFLHECSYDRAGQETQRHSWPMFFNSCPK